MHPLVAFFLNPLLGLIAGLGFKPTLRPSSIMPDYAEQLMLCVIASTAGPQTHFEVRHRNFGRPWVYEPLIPYQWNPTLAPGIQVFIYGLGPDTTFEIEVRSLDQRTGGVSDWARTTMRTLP